MKSKGTVAARLLPLASELRARGYHVRVVIPPWDDPPAAPLLTAKSVSTEIVQGVEVVSVPLASPLAARLPLCLVQTAQAFKPDIIHVFKPKAYSGLSALLLSALRQKFMLDTDDWEGSGGWNDVNPYSLPQKKLFAWQERDLPRRAHSVTVASRTLQSQVWGFGVASEKVLYLPNGLSPAKYANWNAADISLKTQKWRTQLHLENKRVLLVYTRFAEFKAERLIKLFAAILAALSPEVADNTRLLVVGGGFFKEETTLTQLATPFGCADKIITTGMAAWEDLPALLRLGDVALYPFDDNLINRARSSIKFLELMAAERPIVTEAVGELREYLREGEGGHLVPPGNTAAFAQTAARLLQSEPTFLGNFGKQAASRLWSTYTWQNLTDDLERLYSVS